MVCASTPLKFLFSTKLTTPATASAPYTADAPPVTRSIRSSRATGMALVSTRPDKSEGTARRPLINTSVRCGPRPRRSIVAIPPEPLLVPGPMAGIAAGRPRMTSSMATGCDELISVALTLVIGLLETAPMLLMREPVISTRSDDCACADRPAMASTPPRASSAPVLTFVLLNIGVDLRKDGLTAGTTLRRKTHASAVEQHRVA